MLLKKPSLKRRWIKVSLAFIGAILFLVAGALWHLSRGPIEIPPSMVSLFQNQIGTTLHFKKLELVFESWHRPLALSINQFSLGGPEDAYKLEAQQARVTFKLMALLKRRILPTSITLTSPVVRIRKPALLEESSPPLSPQEEILEEEKTILEVVHTSFLTPLHSGSLRKLRQLSIYNGTVFIGDHQGDLSLSGVKAFLSRDKEEIRGTLQFTLEKDQHTLSLSHTLSYHLETRHLHLKTNVGKFILTDWVSLPGVDLQAPLSGHLDVSIPLKSPAGIQGSLEMAMGAGIIDLKEMLPHPLDVEQGILKVCKSGETLLLEEISLKRKNQPIKLEGSVALPQSAFLEIMTKGGAGKTLPAQVRATIGDLNFKELPQLWPETLAPLVRSWFLKNIAQGEVPEARVILKGELGVSPLSFTSHQVEGQLQMKNATLDYITGMPLIEKIEGVAFFDREKFDIKVSKGAYKSLNISEGKVLITGLSQKDQFAAIDLQLKGPVKEALELLDHKPLQYLQKMGMGLEKGEGMADVLLKFKFPVETTLTPAQIKATAEATLTQVGGDLVLENTKHPFKAEEIKLTFSEGLFNLKGGAQIDGYKGNVEWFQDFQKESTLLKASGLLSLQGIKAYGMELGEAVSGPLPLSVVYTKSSQAGPKLDLTAPLEKVKISIPLLAWVKPLGKEATLTVKMALTPQNKPEKVEIGLEGPKESVQLSAQLAKEGSQLETLSIPKFILGDHNFQASLSGKDTKVVSIIGKSLNLEPLWKGWNESSEEESILDAYPALSAKIQLEKVFFSAKEKAYEVRGNLEWKNKRWHSAAINAQLNPPSQKKPLPLLIDLIPDGKGEKLIIKTQDSGRFFRLLGITEDVRKGKFSLEAYRLLPPSSSSRKNHEMKGHIRIEEFYVLNVGLLAQLLSLALITSILDLVTGNGVYFNEAAGEFSQKNNLLTLENFKASGVSLGITCEGMINQKSKALNLRGILIPAHLLNSAISKIPLLGPLLSGGQGCLFGTAYTIKGTTGVPDISVNPLTTFTPGLVCRIFQDSEKPTVAE